MSDARAHPDRPGAALRAAATAPVSLPPVESLAVDRHATILETVRAGLADGARLLLDHEPLVRKDEDPEGVHQARVGIRRVRSVLRVFATELDPAFAQPLDAELARFGRVLGAVRDADVLGWRLSDRIDALPEALDRVAGVRLLSRLAAERRGHLALLLRELDASRHHELLARLVAAIDAPVLMSQATADDRARPLARRRLDHRWKRLRHTVAALPAEPSIAELHAVRIRAKRVRYASDAVAPVVGGPARKLAKHLQPVQDLLGDLHDTAVSTAWLRAAAEAASIPRLSVITAGQLIAADQREAARLLDRWPGAWAKVESAVGARPGG